MSSSVRRRLLMGAGSMEYVDLGLDAYWASCNLGASSPEEAGDLFVYGDTAPYVGDSSWDNVYELKSTQNSGTLPLNRDAARVILGGNWRLPSESIIQNLVDNTKITLVDNKIIMLTSTVPGYTDKSIIFPVEAMARAYDQFGVTNKTYSTAGRFWGSDMVYLGGGTLSRGLLANYSNNMAVGNIGVMYTSYRGPQYTYFIRPVIVK